MRMEIVEVSLAIIVAFVLLVVVWRRLQSGPDEAEVDVAELDPRTARRSMDKQFRKPPNEGGLL